MYTGAEWSFGYFRCPRPPVMKRTTPLLFIGLILILTSCSQKDKTSITILNIPDTTKTNQKYAGNRFPLTPSPYIKLPVGSIQPEGWLLEMLKRQKSGLTGNLGKISAWLQKKDNAWLNSEGKGEWGWEEVPYWLKGYSSLGYLLNDVEMQKETKVWIDGVLSSQRSDGNFGPTFLDTENREDFWPKMIMLYCLQTYYEFTQDKRVIDFMTRFFEYQFAYDPEKFLRGHYWQGVRSGDNLHSVMWLYNQTGDPRWLSLMERIHKNANSWANRNSPLKQKNHKLLPGEKAFPEWYNLLTDWHNVNVAQGFREPATFWQLSHNQHDLNASYEAFRIIRDYFGQVPGGMFGGDEVSRPGFSDPRQAIETCGVVEQMNSDEHLLRITGDLFWADHTEEVAFNTYPAAVMPDFRSLRYLTSPNMVLNDDQNHAPGIFNDGPYLMMNPFSSRCCQHNHTQGWPYFTENLWMATPDDGIAAVLYSASKVTFKTSTDQSVTIQEITHYPFSEELLFKIQTESTAAFPLYLRIPGWATDARVSLNGGLVDVKPLASQLIKIERTWKNGDQVLLELPMKLESKTWLRNNNSTSIHYGPLLFSLKIGESYLQKESDKTAQYDSKWQPGANTAEWPSFEIHPTTAWNYGLQLDTADLQQSLKVEWLSWPENNFPFTTDAVPLEIKAKGKKIPEWTLDQYGLCGTVPLSPAQTPEPIEEITLIPAGAARLRITAFPVTGSNQ